MFVWNFRWGWVNLWEVVRSVFRGPRHMQFFTFQFSTPEQPFEQTQLIARDISSAHPFQPFLMPPHDTENTVSECWWFLWAESLWMASDDVIFVFQILRCRLHLTCSNLFRLLASSLYCSASASTSMKSACINKRWVDCIDYCCNSKPRHRRQSRGRWRAHPRMDPLLTDTHAGLNWYVLHLHK